MYRKIYSHANSIRVMMMMMMMSCITSISKDDNTTGCVMSSVLSVC